MTILLEMRCRDGLRAHPIKDKYIFSGNSKILHTLSEDILTANTFGVLNNLNPTVWLSSFLEDGCKFTHEEFPLLYEKNNFSTYNISTWKDLDTPPSNLEGPTQADVLIELRNAVILIECKFLATLQKSVSTDKDESNPNFWWDQAIRSIVRGYSYVRAHYSDKEFFFIVLSMNQKERTFGQYENWHRIKEQIEQRKTKDPALESTFPAESVNDICRKLSRQIRWLQWNDLKEVLNKCNFGEGADFQSQGKFCHDLVDYLDMKVTLALKLKATG